MSSLAVCWLCGMGTVKGNSAVSAMDTWLDIVMPVCDPGSGMWGSTGNGQ